MAAVSKAKCLELFACKHLALGPRNVAVKCLFFNVCVGCDLFYLIQYFRHFSEILKRGMIFTLFAFQLNLLLFGV